MGDLCSTINKIERAIAEKANGDAWLQRHGIDPTEPRQPPRNVLTLVCRGCLHNDAEVGVYVCKQGYWDPVEYWCWDCMPEDLRNPR